VILFLTHKNKAVMNADVMRWLSVMEMENRDASFGFVYLMAFFPEFRNLFYYRAGGIKHFISFLCPGMSTLFINTPEVGQGLFLQHGFSTIINANSIGSNCWINQQVTIGFSNKHDRPTLKDNVTVYAGAKIIGNVTVGNNVIVGANAVVVKDVPDNCTVVGVPARIIKVRDLNNL
jgi:serine O-acetyltransferase